MANAAPCSRTAATAVVVMGRGVTTAPLLLVVRPAKRWLSICACPGGRPARFQGLTRCFHVWVTCLYVCSQMLHHASQGLTDPNMRLLQPEPHAPPHAPPHAVPSAVRRCKKCEACTQSTGTSNRRCLLVRATAAAAAGHGGAQLAVLGDKAVGAEVDVWWPLDQAWYNGVVRHMQQHERMM